jgi:hypothetical protein
MPSGYTIEEALQAEGNDSGRYLAAGAVRSFWIRAAIVEDALPAIRRILSSSGNAIVESNRILSHIDADLCLFVFDPGSPDFKDSALHAFRRADALIVTGEGPTPKHRSCFRATAPQFMTDEIAAFARGRLGSADFS